MALRIKQIYICQFNFSFVHFIFSFLDIYFNYSLPKSISVFVFWVCRFVLHPLFNTQYMLYFEIKFKNHNNSLYTDILHTHTIYSLLLWTLFYTMLSHYNNTFVSFKWNILLAFAHASHTLTRAHDTFVSFLFSFCVRLFVRFFLLLFSSFAKLNIYFLFVDLLSEIDILIGLNCNTFYFSVVLIGFDQMNTNHKLIFIILSAQ